MAILHVPIIEVVVDGRSKWSGLLAWINRSMPVVSS